MIRTVRLPLLLVAALAAPMVATVPAAADPGVRADPGSVLVVHVSGGAGTLDAAVADARRPGGVDVRHAFGSLHAFSVRVSTSDATAQAARLRRLPGVTAVERGVLRTFDGTPDDPYLPTRQAAYLDAVHAPAAWVTQHGSTTVEIAVVDSGVDVGHPDLAGKIAGRYNATDHSTDVTDKVGHGTFVAGVAAADTDNAIGVAGAGYDTGLLAVKIASPDGTIEIDDEVAGIKWAADHGADVINLSLGGPDSSAAERAAIDYAQHKGVLVVAAAGNDGDAVAQYPAAYPGVLAVGATDPAHGRRADFSSHGSWVTLAAPGVGIFSTVPRAGSTFWPSGTSGYGAGDGTSFSTPLVAGEAALLKAQNPSQDESRLRAALVASAHGYSGQGLGAGQVDFARGLAHVAPTSHPSNVHVDGTSGRVTLVASSTAAAVAFKVGAAPTLAPVRVSGGRAATSFATWGYANGPHTLLAFDCTAYRECNPSPSRVGFTIDNSAPSITGPSAGATVTGLFTVRAANPVGGPLRLLVDGRSVATVAAAPYTFGYSASALSDGRHTLTAQGCSVDGRYCSGPPSASVAVTAAGLHPSVRGLAPEQFSPNGDGVRDASTLTFALPDSERVHVAVRDAAGVVVRSHSFGTLRAGTHRWTWRGTHGDGSRVPDGAYTMVLDSSRGDRRGWVARSVRVDTRAPRLGHPSGGGALFYPVKDGYRDAFTTRTTRSDAGTMALTIRTAEHAVIRTIRVAHRNGAAAISWAGHDRSGKRVPAGTYQWRLSLTDAAGNTSRTPWHRVRVSAKRLVHETAYVTRAGSHADSGGTASCASARARDSSYPLGLRLVNRCATDGAQLAYARYTFTVPAAHAYGSLAMQVLGSSTRRPSELIAAFQTHEGGLEVPGQVAVKRAGLRWVTIASVPAAEHVSARRRVHVTVLLDSYYPGTNNFDIERARLRVRFVVLR